MIQKLGSTMVVHVVKDDPVIKVSDQESSISAKYPPFLTPKIKKCADAQTLRKDAQTLCTTDNISLLMLRHILHNLIF